MPVKLSQPLAEEDEARIEIIPLIDIMFFLLAAFMLVSLQMQRLAASPVELPAASASASPAATKPLAIAVDADGLISLDGRTLAPVELTQRLRPLAGKAEAPPVLIAADGRCPHAAVLAALDAIRAAGITKVSFASSRR